MTTSASRTPLAVEPVVVSMPVVWHEPEQVFSVRTPVLVLGLEQVLMQCHQELLLHPAQ
jgi:hypothetical protein